MAEQTCPKCGTRFSAGDDWAKGAVSLLIPAPAVRDMATQVRCPKCGHAFADSEVRYREASRFKLPLALVILASLIALAWAVV